MEDRKQRIILVGRSQAGKTTLTQYMTDQQLSYHKTQTVQVVEGQFIDTPGEYMEQRGFYGALSVTAADVDIIALVQSAVDESTMFAPNFGSMFFGKPVMGIVTKIDEASPEQVRRADLYLEQAGASTRFWVSSMTGEGMDQLKDWLREK
ncbi:EutP/PduV family microcompartment system protein [Aminipila butyrica]|uniref:EutP/PduV family microcompartment system protein n=1 Tax=Aminipila butyrica TaxID=433296 RepID=A0A858BZS4_9FIRM|nr:EutP/PduV family microcompartment system protein [Aminipila butyrica]QIB70450.1 EutP/PduV family microcompartment system protein [Aminipila butyrica]